MPQFGALLVTLRVILCPARTLQLVQLCVSSITTTSDAVPQASKCSHNPQVYLLQLMLMYLAEPGADCIKPP